MKFLFNILGILVVLFLIWLLSYNKKEVKIPMIIKGILVELVLAFLLVKIPAGRMVVFVLSNSITKVLSYANDGIAFMFGSLADAEAPTGVIMAFQTLGAIIFVSALFNVLYYLGILSIVIKYVGKAVDLRIWEAWACAYQQLALCVQGRRWPGWLREPCLGALQ